MSNGAASVHVSPITAEVELSHHMLPANRQGTICALVRLVGKNTAERQSERLPLNVHMVLDRSGSMAGRPLEQVKDSAQFLIGQLGARGFFVGYGVRQ